MLGSSKTRGIKGIMKNRLEPRAEARLFEEGGDESLVSLDFITGEMVVHVRLGLQSQPCPI
jgi:hypothetical protein